SVDHSGRIATIWLKTPGVEATTETIAIENCTVVYSGGHNQITTSGSLGQTTISENEALYSVAIKGPTVKRNTDLRTEDGYCYIGYVTGSGAGNPPSVFNTDDQKIIDHSWTEMLVGGLEQNFYPATDNTYSLGTASKRWSAIYTTDFNMAGDFLPASSNAQDIGSSSLLWKDGYFIGLYTGHITPRVDEIFNLGSGTYKWGTLYCVNVSSTNQLSSNKLSVSSSAGNGVVTNIVPSTDNTRELGETSYKWSNIYTYKLNVATIETSLIPDVNDNVDLGSGSYQWKKIYCGDLNVSSSAGRGVSNDFVPTTDATYQLGNTSYHWLRTTTDYLYVRSGLGGGVENSLQPSVNSTYNLGDPSYQWLTIYCSGTINGNKINLSATGGNGFASNIVPDTNNARDIGNSSYKWKDLYLQGNISLVGNISAGGVNSNFVPITTNTYDLGSTGYRWQKIWTESIDTNDLLCGSTATFYSGSCIKSNFVPYDNDTYDLGSLTHRWKDIYSSGEINGINVSFSTSAGEGFKSGIMPDTTDTYDIGNSTYYWNDIYSNNIYYKTTFTTFDDEDDLALVEKYIPTDATIEIEKKGIKRKVRIADPESLPWPITGKKDSNGNYFIHAGDSITFLLGALKQLYQEHKRALKRIEILENS
ncbi:MAG: hypothetical protein BV456_09930, partial [Thermoplasmata archaeon M8B2D]